MENTFKRGYPRKTSIKDQVFYCLFIFVDVSKDASKSEFKKSYFKLALIWHPDNIKKKYKYGFANEVHFTKLVAEIFQLYEEAYRTLSNDEGRSLYDSKLQFNQGMQH